MASLSGYAESACSASASPPDRATLDSEDTAGRGCLSLFAVVLFVVLFDYLNIVVVVVAVIGLLHFLHYLTYYII